ncbi:hypothetical protein [Arthrobacter globiformis]|uniref:hypothetical protein n=1 Tax=Arthrobacter globiformis TaxID=1665 RepID=UPI000B415847|nr:hypothetical protein [Arthrobacter globiformis]
MREYTISVSLTDPVSPVFGAVSAATMGALVLVDPAKLTKAQRRTFHAASAVLTGLYTAVTVDRNRTVLVPLNAVAGVAAAAATLRFAEAGDAAESRMVRWLGSAGIQRPRRWLAAGSAALTFVAFLADRAAARKEEYDGVSLDAPEQVRPLTPAVRDLARAILTAAVVPGADALLAQLDQAEEVQWGGDSSSPAIFKVPDDVPRAVPHHQVFPVTARFEAESGLPLQVMLQIRDGKLEHLAIDTFGEPDVPVNEIPDRWPNVSELQFFIDGPDGARLPVQ